MKRQRRARAYRTAAAFAYVVAAMLGSGVVVTAHAASMTVSYQSSPFSIPYLVNIGGAAATTTQPLTLPLFDDSLGPLTNVDITLNATATGSASLTGSVIGPNAAVFIRDLQLRVTHETIDEFRNISTSAVLACTTMPFSPPCQVSDSFPAFSPVLTVSFGPGDAELGDFIGDGVFSLTAQHVATAGVTAGSPVGSMSGTFSGQAIVQYTYVPEPSTLVLAGFGLAGLASRRRRRPKR